MTHYSVLDVTPTTDEWILDYLDPVSRLIAQYGGKYLARTASHERLEGDTDGKIPSPALRIIVAWPSKDAAVSFMNDPEYAPHFKARTAGSISNHYLIEGKDDLA